MWITLLGTPGNPTPPTFDCVFMSAPVVIHKFNNRKAIGFVSNVQPGVNPGSGTGLFVGLYDNGNTDTVTLSTFQDGQLTSTVATLPLGPQIKEDGLYGLVAAVCNDGTELEASVTVFDVGAHSTLLECWKHRSARFCGGHFIVGGESALPGRPSCIGRLRRSRFLLLGRALEQKPGSLTSWKLCGRRGHPRRPRRLWNGPTLIRGHVSSPIA